MMHLPAPGWATALAAALTQRLIRNYEYSGGFGVGFRYGSDDRPSVLVLYPLPVLVHDEEDTSRCEEVIPPYSVNVLELLQEFESLDAVEHVAGEHEGFGDCLRVAGTYQGQPVELYLHHDCPDDIPPAKYRRLDGVVVDYNPQEDVVPCAVLGADEAEWSYADNDSQEDESGDDWLYNDEDEDGYDDDDADDLLD